MANLRIATLAASMFFLIALHKARSAAILDATDECILICDRCYKNDVLLNCANDCLFTSGNIHQNWKRTCPYFDGTIPEAQMVPT